MKGGRSINSCQLGDKINYSPIVYRHYIALNSIERKTTTSCPPHSRQQAACSSFTRREGEGDGAKQSGATPTRIADMIPTEEGMQRLREALAECSSETQRLVTQPVLEIPAVGHMLTVFLSDTSR